jgi:hypothetical protein
MNVSKCENGFREKFYMHYFLLVAALIVKTVIPNSNKYYKQYFSISA